MQEIKESLKRLGDRLRANPGDRQEILRKKLHARTESPVRIAAKPFSFPLLFSFGVMGVFVLFLSSQALFRSSLFVQEDSSSSSSSSSSLSPSSPPSSVFTEQGAMGLPDPYRITPPYISAPPEEDTSSSSQYDALLAFEDAHGVLFEQSMSIRLLTQEHDIPEKVSALFTSLGGYLETLSDQGTYATLTGAIPADSRDFFYEELEGFVKNDAFIQKNVQGERITPEAFALAESLDALRLREADVIAELQRAETDEEKIRLQEELGALSQDIAALLEGQETLHDRGDFVTVSVAIEELPSLWASDNSYDLRRALVGFDEPSLWQRVCIHVLLAVFTFIEFMSIAFWMLIPASFFLVRFLRRRKLLRAVE